MRYTDALEKVEAANGSWAELFKKGPNLRRTEVVSWSAFLMLGALSKADNQMIGTWLVQM